MNYYITVEHLDKKDVTYQAGTDEKKANELLTKCYSLAKEGVYVSLFSSSKPIPAKAQQLLELELVEALHRTV